MKNIGTERLRFAKNFGNFGTEQAGFTLFEVILSLSLITILSLALTSIMRGSFDVREALSQTSSVTHRLATAMSKISADLQHAYILNEKDIARFGDPQKRKMGAVFVILLESDGDVVRFTTMDHTPLLKNSNESDTTFVVYRLQKDKDTSRMNLMRGETRRVPEDFKEDPPLEILARDIKTFNVRAWRGDEWSKEPWDSDRREFKGLIPRMIQITLEAYLEAYNPDSGSTRVLSATQEPVLKAQTVVNLPMAFGLPELKTTTSSAKWDRL